MKRCGGMIWWEAEEEIAVCERESQSHRATGSCKDTLMEERRGFEQLDWKWRASRDRRTDVLLLLAADWMILDQSRKLRKQEQSICFSSSGLSFYL